MSKIIIAFLLIPFVLNKARAQETDTIACKKFVDTLNIIRKYILEGDSDFQLKRVNAAVFLYRITKISSTSRIDFIGPIDPKLSDYQKWLEWYNLNKNLLRFDISKNEIFLLDKKE